MGESWRRTVARSVGYVAVMVGVGLAGVGILSGRVGSAAEETPLSALAASLAPGTWGELATKGLTPGLLQVDNGVYMANVLEYQESGVWDPGSRQVLFVGGPHNREGGCEGRFISYREATNTWQREPDPSPDYIHCTHTYHHNTINPDAGELYLRPYLKAEIWKYQIRTRTWSKLTNIPQREFNCCGAIQYFPERRGVLFVGTNEIAFYRVDRGSWSSPWSSIKTGPYHASAEYSPVDKVLVFGGGSGVATVYKMDQTGRITHMRDSPYPLDCGGHAIFTVDPVSGKFLLFGENGTFYEYDAMSDHWRLQSQRPPFFDVGDHGPVDGSIAIPISTHGVVMVLTYSARGPRVFVYRHAPGPVAGSSR